ncbi:MAG: hypothetical protein H6937_09480 [Burkholderiales bacterium]|nr:hypothetical protein [Burkholderiales bacterium]
MSDYDRTGKPYQSSRALSKTIRDEFALVEAALDSKADIDSPNFPNNITIPTEAFGSSGQKGASLDFVNAAILANALSGTLPGLVGNDYKLLRTVSETLGWTDDYVRKLANSNLTAAINNSRATVASHATTADIWSALGNEIDFTGTSTITDFPDAPQAGASRILHCAGACTFTHNANITVPGGLDYTAQAGDIVIVHALSVTTFKIAIFNQSGIIREIPIFSTQANSSVPITSHEDITKNWDATGLSSPDLSFIYGDSLWIAFSPNAVKSEVASSVDGSTWVIRALTSTAKWSVGHDGTDFLAIDLGGLDVVTSADGVSWSNATDITFTKFMDDTANAPVSLVAGTFIAQSATTTELWKTSDTGATWATKTLPAANGSKGFYKINGYYWYWSSGTTAYTSTTGETGSWTSRTLPDVPLGQGYIWQNPDGSLMFQVAVDGDVYRTTDGLNWTLLSIPGAPNGYRIILINDVYAMIKDATTRTHHGNYSVNRTGTLLGVKTAQHRINQANGLTLMCDTLSDKAFRVDSNIKGVFF